MDLIKKTGNYYLTNLTRRELYALLKMQISFRLCFMDNTNTILEGKSLHIGTRTIINDKQALTVNREPIDFDNFVNILNEFIRSVDGKYKLCILIDDRVFKANEPLLFIADRIKEILVSSCVYISYDNKLGRYTIMNKPLPTKNSDALYYWEDNCSMLIFSKTGPFYLKDENKLDSIERLICD